MKRLAGSLLASALFASSSVAAAATEAEKEAQGLFVQAMKLLSTKQYAEACDKLARSQELDPGMGTQFRLAECYEKLGRPASAFIEYTSVADAAKAAGKGDREAVARRRATALEPKVARLTISLPSSVASLPGLEVLRDGVAQPEKVWGTPQPVDPGDHLVTVRATGKKAWSSRIWAEAAAKHTMTVGALEDVVVAAPPPPPPRSLAPAIGLGVGGGVAIVLGAVFAGLRAQKTSAAHTVHDQISAAGGNCLNGGMARFASQCSTLSGDTSSGDAFGTASVVGFAVGGAALAGMATYLLWPKNATARTGFAVTPSVGTEGAGLLARGLF